VIIIKERDEGEADEGEGDEGEGNEYSECLGNANKNVRATKARAKGPKIGAPSVTRPKMVQGGRLLRC
jgi:hypothetical protein